GATMHVRKSAFDRVGGFDEAFFLYREDDDLCRRIRESGGQVWYEPSLRVRHIGSVVGRKSRHLAGSTDYYLRKHYAERPLFTARRIAHRLLKRFA
ncbi:MAG: galactosyltransferase-related protein, partial [Dehalococcoidia bacterium]